MYCNLSEEQTKIRALEIVRYQNFKTNIALDKMDCEMPKVTFDAGVAYLKRGTINKGVLSKKLIKELDFLVKNCVQPLTPSFSEKRKFMTKKALKKDVKLPINKLEILQKPVTAKFDYGVRIGDCIKILNSEKETMAFIRGMRFIEPHAEAIPVQVEIKVINEEE